MSDKLRELELDRRDTKMNIHKLSEEIRLLQKQLIEENDKLLSLNEAIGKESQTKIF